MAFEALVQIRDRLGQEITARGLATPAETTAPLLTSKNALELYGKSQIMGGAISTASVERGRYRWLTWLQQKVLTQFTSDFEMVGTEYLQEARERAEKEGKRLLITPRHKSDLESAMIRTAFTRGGFGELINNARWIAGVNMLKRLYTRVFMRSENVIYIATPADSKEVDQLISNTDEYDPQREVLENIQAIFRRTNQIALARTRQSADKGENLIVYPEAGRSYNGLLKEAPEQVAVYFPRDENTLVVPLVVYGAEEVNPPNRRLRFEKAIPGLRQKIKVAVGEPYPSSEVWMVWNERTREAKLAGIREKINPAEWPMANIANVDPTNIRPEELAHYKRLIQMFAPQRLSPALAQAA